MFRTLERMDRDGLIVRRASDRDRRRRLASVTPPGRAALAGASDEERHAVPPVPDPEALRLALLQIVRSLPQGPDRPT